MDMLIEICARYLIWVVVAGGVLFWLVYPRKVRTGAFALVSLALAYGFGKLAGHLWYDPRPFVVGHFAPLVAHAADNGFPSDHMLLGAAIASIVYARNRVWGLVLWILALIVGAARVLAGIHHWVDLAGSILAAVIAVVLVHWVLSWLWPEREFGSYSSPVQ